ncbi:DUF2079 domain-containing protein [Candidatus Bathyarchaeota archaeon]|nr:DUF2079 domain-containing protein [Candidatus Bathyarchaeota archaeon]
MSLIKRDRWFNLRFWVASDYFLLFVIALIYVVAVSSFAVLTHYSFYTNAWDLGIYAQALYSTLNYGKLLYYTVEAVGNPSRSLFGIHFSPFLFLLVPVYAIYQNPITLLVLRPVAISMGLIPLYLIIRENKIVDRKFVILFAVIYLVYPPMLVPISNFDVLSFIPAIFLSALYYVEKKRYLRAYIFILLALTVNEFVSLIVVATAVYILLSGWREILGSLRRKKVNRDIAFSLVLLLTGVLWFALASAVITYFNPAALETKWEWGELGSSPREIIFNALANPVKTLNILFNDGERKFLYVVALLGPLAFTSLLDPLALVMALPWLAASLLSINPLYYSIETQYPAFVSPFIFLSAIKGIKRLMGFNMSIMKRIVTLMVIVLLISTLLIPSSVRFKRDETSWIITLALKEIPSDASASVMPEIFPHICNRLNVYPYFVDGVDYVLINVYSWWYDVTLPRPAHIAARWCDAQISDEYGILLNMKGIVLYKRGYKGAVKYFSGVRFTYTFCNVTDSSGKVIWSEEVSGNVLVHETGNPAPLFFRVPYKFLPPGKYNVTASMKVSPIISGVFIRFELRTKPGETRVLTKEYFSEEFIGDGWETLNFSFTIKKTMPIEIAVYVSNFTDIYFHSLSVLQVSGA